MKVCISSGHSTKCQGAADIINEVEEATRVADEVKVMFCDCSVDAEVFHDTVSDDQTENLNRIVDWHNARARDLDISVHFNSSDGGTTSKPIGVEVLYLTQKDLAGAVSEAISEASGLINRGPKYRDNLFVLNNTSAPAILLEICFVNSSADVDLYRTHFPLICEAIVDAVLGTEEDDEDEIAPEPVPEGVLFHTIGPCSYFGGPEDQGVSPSEGLAFHASLHEDNQHLFLPMQPDGTTGLARRLNAKGVHYVACRWNYDVTPKTMLAGDQLALVTNVDTGMAQTAFCADWGPHEDTGRVADLSPALMRDLNLETDYVVEVIYPWKGD